MDKDSAINALENAIRNINLLRKVAPFSSEHVRWMVDTKLLLEEIFGQSSTIYLNFVNLKYDFRGSFIGSPYTYEIEKERRDLQAYQSDLTIADGILRASVDQISRKGMEEVYSGKDSPKESSEIVKILSLIDTKLRKTFRNKPKDESEVNDALENLFIGADLEKEFSREKEHIPYSSKTYVPDFVFTRISTIVEAKLCDSLKREKEIIAEINDDILAYKTVYANLIFVIYDLGMIRDDESFKGSLEESHQHVIVHVIKH